jgi:pimeloyl-ACP methyl ester carboxylesterase
MRSTIKFPAGKTDEWHGGIRHKFKLKGHEAWIVEPKNPARGCPWSWCMEWPEAFVKRVCVPELLERGFHHVHINICGTYASPDGIKILNKMYELTQSLGFAKQVALIGLSLGGLYSYRWASENSEKVAVIYADAPVCNFYKEFDLTDNIKKAYGFKSDEEMCNYPGIPVKSLEPIAKAKIPVIHVIGADDNLVPPAMHSDILAKNYQALGGEIEIIRRNLWGHHPHGCDDSSKVLSFILNHYWKD